MSLSDNKRTFELITNHLSQTKHTVSVYEKLQEIFVKTQRMIIPKAKFLLSLTNSGNTYKV